MLSCIISWNVECPKWSVLGYAASIVSISMMVLQIGAFFGIEHFPGSRILVLNFGGGANFPKIMSN